MRVLTPILRAVTVQITLAVANAVSAPVPSAPAATDRPDIVYVLMDDLGFSDCGFSGGNIRTPNIDALATRGAVFQNYYVQPLCSSARACLLTGRYPTRHGVYGALKNDSPYGLPLNERTLPQALRDAGYTTAICGKWHLGDHVPAFRPLQRGFDHQYGLWLGMINYTTHISADGFGRRADWFRDDQPCDDKGYSTHLLAKEAARLIRAQPPHKPLFLYLAFNAVHAPWSVPDSYLEPYRHLPPNRRVVAGMLAAADEAIGEVMDALAEAHRRENTLVIFSSDNGGTNPGDRTMNTPLRAGKASLYEGGIRSSAFALLPGRIPAGLIVDPVHLVDWYPTLLRLAGASLDQPLPVDGVDIWPTLTEGKSLARDALLVAGTPRRAALRMGDWKLILNPVGPGALASPGRPAGDIAPDPEVDRVELYNVARDLPETTDLSSDEPDRVRSMVGRLRSMMTDAAPSLAAIQAHEQAAKTARPR